MVDFAAIVRHYRADAHRRAAEDRWWGEPTLPLADCIRRACVSMRPGRRRLVRHGHQCNLPAAVLSEATEVLLAAQHDISAAAAFHDLYTLVCSAFQAVHGAGELYCYDVAQRIGLRLGLYQDRVYLHRGTRAGARALNIKVTGREYILMDELPPELRVLSASEAEDVLCIYKSYFATGADPSQRCGSDYLRARGCTALPAPAASLC